MRNFSYLHKNNLLHMSEVSRVFKSLKGAKLRRLYDFIVTISPYMRWIKKVQVGNDQEKTRSEINSHSKNRSGEKLNWQLDTGTLKTHCKSSEQLFPNRWPLSYLNLT